MAEKAYHHRLGLLCRHGALMGLMFWIHVYLMYRKKVCSAQILYLVEVSKARGGWLVRVFAVFR